MKSYGLNRCTGYCDEGRRNPIPGKCYCFCKGSREGKATARQAAKRLISEQIMKDHKKVQAAAQEALDLLKPFAKSAAKLVAMVWEEFPDEDWGSNAKTKALIRKIAVTLCDGDDLVAQLLTLNELG